MAARSTFGGPYLLDKQHNFMSFDCGVEALNIYLKKYAFQNQQSRGSRTYVAIGDDEVVGYFTLAYGSVSPEMAPPRVGQGLGRYPIPVMVLARLAVDVSLQGKGLGKALLKHALLKTINAAEIAGLRAIVVHAKDYQAKNFYERYGFISSALDEFHLFLLCKDIQENLA